MVFEVADDGVHIDAVVFASDGGRCAAERLLAHVERDEPPQRAAARERVEEQARLLRGAGAELDERVGAGARRDVAACSARIARSAPRRVVLGEPRDLVEELAPTLVVEPLRRERLRRSRESGTHVRLERAHHGVGFEVHVDADVGRHTCGGRYSDVIMSASRSSTDATTTEPSGTSLPIGIVVERLGSHGRAAHEQRVAEARRSQVVTVGEEHVESGLRDGRHAFDDVHECFDGRFAVVDPVEGEREQDFGVGVAFDGGAAVGVHVGPQLVADPLVEAPDRAVQREEPGTRHERRVALFLDGGTRRRESRGRDECATPDSPRVLGEGGVLPDRCDGAVPLRFERAVDVPADAPTVGIRVARGLVPRCAGLCAERVGARRRAADGARPGARDTRGDGTWIAKRRARSGSRRRSGGGWDSPSCGTTCASRRGAWPTTRRAAPCSRGRRTLRSTRGTGNDTKPGYPSKSEAVHSHTSPNIWRTPHLLAAPGCDRFTSEGPKRGGPARHRFACSIVAPAAATSHSASVGSRAPDQRANASASYQHTCCTGSSSGRSSTRPKRRRDPRAVALAVPELRRLEGGLPAPRPPGERPQTSIVVTTVRRRTRGTHRSSSAWCRCGTVRASTSCAGPFVVVGPRIVAGADHERATGNRDVGSRNDGGEIVLGVVAVGRARVAVGVRVGEVVHELDRGQHRLVVLVLVLYHHPVDEAACEQRLAVVERGGVEHVEPAFAHVGHEPARGRRIEDRK